MRPPFERNLRPIDPDADAGVRPTFYQYQPKFKPAPERMFELKHTDYDINSTIGIYSNPAMLSLPCRGIQEARGQTYRGNDISFSKNTNKMAKPLMYYTQDLVGNYGRIRPMKMVPNYF